MEVYEFDKTLLNRLEECMQVLSWKDEVISASQVKNEWAYYIEMQIEPAGWQALWKIPRVICEELKLRYPIVVFGYVDQVLFKELKAIFVIEAVQDDDVHIPERHAVALEDLYPTTIQENNALNVDRTAECIDRLRFFYNHVWMPWDIDNDDDLNWVEKYLEMRIRFCYDLRKRDMKRALVAHIRILLTEAKYLQHRREYLEIDLSDDEGESLNDSALDRTQITELMRLHLRLAMIRSEIEILQNPEMRHIYEETHFGNEKHLAGNKNSKFGCNGTNLKDKEEKTNYMVTLPRPLKSQLQLLNLIKERIPESSSIQMAQSLQDVLNICNASDCIFLSPGKHSIKFLDYLNDNGCISGITVIGDEKMITDLNPLSLEYSNHAELTSQDDDDMMLVLDGNFTLEHLIIDCKNVRTGILVKNGKVRLRNCLLIGDGKTSTQQAVVCCKGAELDIVNCVLDKFANGITMHDGSSLKISNTIVQNCMYGLNINGYTSTALSVKNIQIKNAKNCGIYVSLKALKSLNVKKLELCTFKELQNYTPNWNGDCQILNCSTNICIFNQLKSIISEKSMNLIVNSDNHKMDEINDDESFLHNPL